MIPLAAADMSGENLLLIMAGITIAIVVPYISRRMRDRKKRSLPKIKPVRDSWAEHKSDAEVRRSADRILVQLVDTSREITGQMDTRIRMLNQLIREADETISRLEAMQTHRAVPTEDRPRLTPHQPETTNIAPASGHQAATTTSQAPTVSPSASTPASSASRVASTASTASAPQPPLVQTHIASAAHASTNQTTNAVTNPVATSNPNPLITPATSHPTSAQAAPHISPSPDTHTTLMTASFDHHDDDITPPDAGMLHHRTTPVGGNWAPSPSVHAQPLEPAPLPQSQSEENIAPVPHAQSAQVQLTQVQTGLEPTIQEPVEQTLSTPREPAGPELTQPEPSLVEPATAPLPEEARPAEPMPSALRETMDNEIGHAVAHEEMGREASSLDVTEDAFAHERFHSDAWQQQTQQRVVELHRKGYTIAEIARMLSLPRQEVSLILGLIS